MITLSPPWEKELKIIKDFLYFLLTKHFSLKDFRYIVFTSAATCNMYIRKKWLFFKFYNRVFNDSSNRSSSSNDDNKQGIGFGIVSKMMPLRVWKREMSVGVKSTVSYYIQCIYFTTGYSHISQLFFTSWDAQSDVYQLTIRILSWRIFYL